MIVPLAIWSVPLDGTLSAVITLATDGDVIEVTQPVPAADVPVGISKMLVIRGQGAAVTSIELPERTNGTIIYSTVTFADIAINGTGAHRSLQVVGGDLTLENVVVQGGSSTTNGGCLQMTSGSLTATDTVFRLCDAVDGGAVSVTSGPFACSRCTFESNTVTRDGGALIVFGSAPTTLVDSIFQWNQSLGRGGALVLTSTLSTVTVERGIFDANTATTYGGAVSLTNGNAFTATGTTFRGNNAEQGGAIACESAGCAVVLTDPVMSDNAATAAGGHVWLDTGRLTVAGGTFTRGHARGGEGGAIRAAGSVVDLTDVALASNDAFGDGGAIYATTGSHLLERVKFCDNTSQGSGGALTFTLAGTLDNVVALRNTANIGGAFRLGDNAVVRHGTFVGNAASISGSAIDGGGAGVDVAVSDSVFVDQLMSSAISAAGGNLDLLRYAAWNNVAGDVGANVAASGAVALTTAPFPVLPLDCSEPIPVYLGELGDQALDLDPDGTPGDLGATGGPLADAELWISDGDPVPGMWDCEPYSDLAFPGNPEIPGDGIDNDCLDGDEPLPPDTGLPPGTGDTGEPGITGVTGDTGTGTDTGTDTGVTQGQPVSRAGTLEGDRVPGSVGCGCAAGTRGPGPAQPTWLIPMGAAALGLGRRRCRPTG